MDFDYSSLEKIRITLERIADALEKQNNILLNIAIPQKQARVKEVKIEPKKDGICQTCGNPIPDFVETGSWKKYCLKCYMEANPR